jgi:hypothetical protein
MIDAPCAASAFRRSSSSEVHGRAKGRILSFKDHRPNGEHDCADPNQDSGPVLGNGWRRFHSVDNLDVIFGFPTVIGSEIAR